MRTSHATRIGTSLEPAADDGPHAGAAVDRRRAADADEQRARLLASDREQQLAEPAARRAQRVELVGAQARQPDRLRRLDDGGAVRQHAASAPTTGRPSGSETAADCQSPPSDACEHLGRSLAAVGDRQLVDLDAVDAPQAGREQRAAASSGERTPLRLAGDASASTLRLLSSVVLDAFARPPSSMSRSVAYDSPSRARKTSPTPTPTDASIACSPMPNATPCAYATP